MNLQLKENKKMSSERQPLLGNIEIADSTENKTLARPDLRNSPENTLVDVQSDDNGKIC